MNKLLRILQAILCIKLISVVITHGLLNRGERFKGALRNKSAVGVDQLNLNGISDSFHTSKYDILHQLLWQHHFGARWNLVSALYVFPLPKQKATHDLR